MITINNKTLRGKKAQAAMEFLTTYGWAILILIIVIVALANLGVFRSPSTPNTCNVAAPFACSDVIFDDGVSVAILAGDSPSNITIKANNVATFSVTAFRPSGTTCDNSPLPALKATFNGNGDNVLGLDCATSPAGNKESGEVDITYTLIGGGVAHTTTLKYAATRENTDGAVGS